MPVDAPTHHVIASSAARVREVAERITALQAVRFRHPHILQGDLAILDHL